ncbi:MAG TPA: hypothetical protein VGL38_07190 [bacterium]|jgi:hypothetical protein
MMKTLVRWIVVWMCAVFWIAYPAELPVTPDRTESQSPIQWSRGVLALVRMSAPDVPVYAWNAGSVECSQATPGETLYLKNFGTEQIDITSPPLLAEASVFSRITTCPCTGVLNPGQINSCSLTLSFSPSGNGIFNDTLRVQTNAWNSYGGFVRFPLSGISVTTPAAPQVVVQVLNNDVHLQWAPVTRSVLGCLLTPSDYQVFSSDNASGPFQLQGATSGPEFDLHDVFQNNSMLYFMVEARAN